MPLHLEGKVIQEHATIREELEERLEQLQAEGVRLEAELQKVNRKIEELVDLLCGKK